MKKLRVLLIAALTVIMTCLSVAAFAADRSAENPYKDNYTKEAAMLRHPGSAKLVYFFMTPDRQPIPGVTMIYNTTKVHDLKATADANGKVIFDVKGSELFYIRQVVYKGQTLPVSGSDVINNVEKQDVRKGLVIWNCIVKYGDAAFMSYKGN
jgi:hypothetical protein